MLIDKAKVTSDYGSFGGQRKNIFSIYAVCFLYVLVVVLFVFNFLTITKVKVLENEVETLKQTLYNVKLFDDNLIKEMIGFEDEEDIEVYDSEEEPQIVVSDDLLEYEYDEDPNPDNDTNIANDSYFLKLMHRLNLTTTSDDKYQSAANLTKDATSATRSKRSVIAATDDGVIINSESYAERRAKNLSSRYALRGGSVTQYPARPSSIGSPWPVYPYPYPSTPSYNRASTNTRRTTKTPNVLSRRSRVKHHEDGSRPFRRVVKVSNLKQMGSYLDSYEDSSTSSPDFTIVRDTGFTKRRRLLKPLASAHFNGDTSSYVYGQHPNYLGNGHLRHPHSRFIDWKAASWVRSLGMDSHFTLNNGYLTIKDSGLYFVYSQVYYLDEHDVTGYRVLKNDQMIFQCTNTIHSTERKLRGNTCFTAGVEHFSANDKLSIEDITEGMLSKFETGKSFFGVIKLGDARV
ncbi:uncharacterized protein egr [Diabrotica undecimpunctata]|uniref:uncharacterized protein egr n=1 Tax=Diabrotica undecimpunctata TaxID=50387 RepID=UPI003B63B3E4